MAQREFKLTAASATAGYSVDEPVIVGQQPKNGGQSLTVMIRIYPSPPPRLSPVLRFAPTKSGTDCVAVDAPSSLPVNILITLTIEPPPIHGTDEIKVTATSATAGYSVDEPSIMGSHAHNGGKSVTAWIRIYPSPPPPLPPPSFPWWIVQPDPIAFGQAVRSARTRAGVSQAELSRRTGLSEMTIRNIERGIYACSPKTRDAVIAVLAAAGQPLDPNPKKDEPTE